MDMSASKDAQQPQDLVVIIGIGPVGIRCARTLLGHSRSSRVIYCDEPWTQYYRVQLSTLLAGHSRFDHVLLPLAALEDERVETRPNLRV